MSVDDTAANGRGKAGQESSVARLGVGALLLVIGIGCGGAIAIAPDIAAAVLVLLIPGLIAVMIDPTPGRAVGRAILLFQGAASVRPMTSIWFHCDGINACVGMVTDRQTVLTVLLAAGFGLVLTLVLPIVLKVLDDRRTELRRNQLMGQRQALIEEWELRQ